MSIVMQLQDVAESTRLGPLSGEVRAGEILHLVGPNGAGKSTLLARMAGMTSGKGRATTGSMVRNKTRAASRLSFTTADAAVCNAGLALPDTASAR
mgnify:CR=1 FL=1